jgi:hypothetical protein
LADHRKFDFIAVMPHATGKSAMLNYLRQCGDVALNLFESGKSAENLTRWLDGSTNEHLGLIVDRPNKPLPMEIVNLAVPRFSLLLQCRDIIDHVKSMHNFNARMWSAWAGGLSLWQHSNRQFLAGSLDKYVKNVLLSDIAYFSDAGYWHKTFAALRAFAGPVAVVEFTEFTAPGRLPEIMRRVGAALFDNPYVWNGPVADFRFQDKDNSLLLRLVPLMLTDAAGRLACSLAPCPREFIAYMKRDAGLEAASYSPEAIDWRIGDFKGDLCFVCDAKEISASGLSKKDFVRGAGALLEAEGRKQLLEYTQRCNAGVAKADELFNSVKVSPEQVIETIRRLGSPTVARYREIIRSQAEELAAVGVDVTERWAHAKELLSPDGFSRPLEQRYSYLRDLILELLQGGYAGGGGYAADGLPRYNELLNQHTSLQQRCNTLSEQYANLRQRYTRLKTSLSWKLTAPVRAIGRFVKKMKDGK